MTFSTLNIDIQGTSGRAVGFGPNANDDHVFFTAQPTTSKTYACFLVKIPAIVGARKPIYFCAPPEQFGVHVAGDPFVRRDHRLELLGG